MREIARRLGQGPSTISRELRRNASTRTFRLDYKASTAQWHAERRARRPKVAKLVTNDRLRNYVQQRLSGDKTPMVERGSQKAASGRAATSRIEVTADGWQAWSPQQISARLKLELPNDESMQISHEAIYQALYVQSRAPAAIRYGGPTAGDCAQGCTPPSVPICIDCNGGRERR